MSTVGDIGDSITYRWGWNFVTTPERLEIVKHYKKNKFFRRIGTLPALQLAGSTYYTPHYYEGKWFVYTSKWVDDKLDHEAYSDGMTYCNEKDCEEWVRRARRRKKI